MSNMKGALGNMMRQAQQMQEKMEAAQRKLAEQEVEGQAGGGMVTGVMTGKHAVKRVTLAEGAFEEDREFLEDLIAAAVNDAVARVEDATKSSMADVTGGLNLPPGMKLPF